MQLFWLKVTIEIAVSPLDNQNFSKAILEIRAKGSPIFLLGSYVYLERRPKRAQDLQATMAEWNALSTW